VSVEQVTVPDIGGAEGAEVIEVLVAVGDEVAIDQGLIVLESDKASMEIPSTAAGVVVELLASEGDQLEEGAPVARIEVSAETAAPVSDPAITEPPVPEPAVAEPRPATSIPAPAVEKAEEEKDETAAADTPSPEPAVVQAAAPAAPPSGGSPVYAGPAVRKLAREFGIDLGQVSGSGPGGRILKEDLHQYVQRSLAAPVGGGAALPEVPEVDFARFGEVEISPRSKLDKLTAANMQRSWLNVPHVTQFDDADITGLEAFRRGLKGEAEQRGIKLSPLPFILKACAVALRHNPKLNSALAAGGEELVHKHYVHIGMAVDTPAGLVVPVIRDVDRKTVWEIAAEVMALAARARERKLTPAEMQGGCFSVSSLGNLGGRGFTPIVNTPEVGILGVSKAAIQPVWDGQAFAPRTLLPLALSYDHRVVNGADGGRFLSELVELLGDIRRLSL
jgi:pyruvate dehydrogenase E2 component (dihydrolipoamide acetyltransferase)